MIIRLPLHYKSHLPIWIGNLNRYFGWGEDKLQDKCILWHNGGTSGFNSYLALNKELRVGIVLLSNYSFSRILLWIIILLNS